MSDLSRRKFLKASVAGVGTTAAIAGCDDGSGAGSKPPPSRGTSPEMEPPVTQPPAMQPPAQPPTMQPPTTQPPATQPPPTMQPPPVMQPPPTEGMPPGMMGTAGMPLRALGKTGLMVSIVGFGSGSQYLRATEADAEKIIQRAIELGINYFDTAASYGNGASERRLGKYLVPTHRSKVVLVSKCGERTAE